MHFGVVEFGECRRDGVQVGVPIAGLCRVTGAHCIHEWWMRNAFPSRIEAALTQLWQHAANGCR